MTTPDPLFSNRRIVQLLFANGILCALMAIVAILFTGSLEMASTIGLICVSICSFVFAWTVWKGGKK